MSIKYWIIGFGLFIFASCGERQPEVSSLDPINWAKRSISLSARDSLTTGASYLSVYSEIYSQTINRTHSLVATVSMRNVNRADSVFITKAEYFNTEGASIRTYFDKPIYLAPLETVEIVIDQLDDEGGTGGNFVFDWSIKPNTQAPLFEGIMISTYGQQGLSFSTQGKQIQ